MQRSTRERLVFSRAADIQLLYAHRHYIVGFTDREKEIWKGLGEAWLSDCRRRTYDRIELITDGPCPPDVYNLWRGFGVEPKAGAWRHARGASLVGHLLGQRGALSLAGRLARLLRPESRQAGRGRGRAPRPEGHRQGHGRADADAHLPQPQPAHHATPSTWSATSTPTWSTRCSCSSTRHSGPATSRARARSRR